MNKIYLILGSLLATQVVRGDELNSGDTAWILTFLSLGAPMLKDKSHRILIVNVYYKVNITFFVEVLYTLLD